MPSTDNKRIAKNTAFLYFRMLLSIIVNLYTVRVVWHVLGVDDYGIYNVVGGIVIMFAFLNNAMVASSQRFISFELGRGNNSRLQKTFSISLTVHILIAIVVFILSETIGVWFLNTKLNIPIERMTAANWVLQCSIATFIITIISVPYNACIVAHERMKIFGFFGILEVLLKLAIVFILIILPFDKLISYACLLLCVSILMRLLYGLYCKKHFEECHYVYSKNVGLMKSMISFAGWSFLGNLGFTIRDQGLNIVINLFFNVAVNAAKGIANQMGGVINGFSQNFLMALNPQITKRYAAGNYLSMMNLVYSGCKFSALLMMLIVIPLFFVVPQVLKIWLGDVTEYTTGFLQLVLIMVLIDSMASPITTALQATGRIRLFQIIISIIMLSSIPIACLLLLQWKIPYIVLYSSIFTSILALIARLILLRRLIEFSYMTYLKKVIFRIIPTAIISLIFAGLIHLLISPSLLGLLLYGIITVSIYLISAFFFGLNLNERRFALDVIRKRINK